MIAAVLTGNALRLLLEASVLPCLFRGPNFIASAHAFTEDRLLLAINGATNTTELIADSNSTASDGRSAITLQENQASLLVNNQTTGEAHGLTVNQTQTVLSGGTQSTTGIGVSW